MKNQNKESELWNQILTLWPTAMQYEYTPVSFIGE